MNSPHNWFALLLLPIFLAAFPAEGASSEETLAAIVAAPQPEYPYQARLNNFEGKGLFQIRFNFDSGRAETVTVARSTGYIILDKAAIKALTRWQVKPRTFEKIEVPIAFHMSGEEAALLRALRAHVIFAPAPVAPLDTRMHNIGGYGRFQLTIDSNTGRVTDVKIVSTTGDRRLDEASMRALRRWRFVPHTYKTFIVPVSF